MEEDSSGLALQQLVEIVVQTTTARRRMTRKNEKRVNTMRRTRRTSSRTRCLTCYKTGAQDIVKGNGETDGNIPPGN